MKLLASLALLGAATLLANWWSGLFENQWLAFGVGFAILITYGFIYDRAQASKRKPPQAPRIRD